MARFKITLDVNVDLDDWALEYGCTTAEALKMALAALTQPGHFSCEGAPKDLIQIWRVKGDVRL